MPAAVVTPLVSAAIGPLAAMDQAALLALNNAHATELSWLTPERLAVMLGRAFYARGMGDVAAALIAFDTGRGYDGWHFANLAARFGHFVYIDRIVVAPAARGRGLAAALYADLFDEAARAGHHLVACEVNIEPPNPVSLAFHARAGFSPAGEATLPDGSRTVRYLVRNLPPAPACG